MRAEPQDVGREKVQRFARFRLRYRHHTVSAAARKQQVDLCVGQHTLAVAPAVRPQYAIGALEENVNDRAVEQRALDVAYERSARRRASAATTLMPRPPRPEGRGDRKSVV